MKNTSPTVATVMNQFKIEIYGDVGQGKSLLPAESCDRLASLKGVVGSCAYFFDGTTTTQLYGGSIVVKQLPIKNGQPFSVSFDLSNGPDHVLIGSVTGTTIALETIPLQPAGP